MLVQANAFKIPLRDKSVHCSVGSPPYYSLRKYAGEQEFIFGDDKDCAHEWGASMPRPGNEYRNDKGNLNGKKSGKVEISKLLQSGTGGSFCHKCNAWRGAYGLEPTLQSYIDHTVEWCREVWRVLRDDGTFFINLGDSYNGSGGDHKKHHKNDAGFQGESFRGVAARNDVTLKPKDLMGVPWRVALALQADGWYLRSDIIWHKPNPMPESVTDRPTKAHEYVFLLTKKAKYFYDADAVREKTLGSNAPKPDGKIETHDTYQPNNRKGYGSFKIAYDNPSGRNKRTVWDLEADEYLQFLNWKADQEQAPPDVWKIATAPYSGAHFATYPPALVEPCIKAGTSEKGVCPECGNPWERETEVSYELMQETNNTRNVSDDGKTGYAEMPRKAKHVETLGWRATCEHDLAPIPATVLDPFSGSGTTLLVARKLGRKGIGLDISAEYLDLARERLSLKALDEWENGVPGETTFEDLPLFSSG